jgi:hypothetical protein
MDDQIIFNDERAIAAFNGAVAHRFRPETDVAITRFRGDKLMGGFILTEYYRHHSIQLIVYSWDRYWMTRDLLYIVSDYAFNQLKVKHVFADSKESQVGFDLNVGFKIVARVENFYPTEDKLILRMDRQDCRFLDIKPRRVRSNLN